MAYAVRDQAIYMVGFTQLQKALSTIEGKGEYGLEYELQKRLRDVGEKVAHAAPAFVTHRTGHGGSAGIRLEDSVRVSVTKKTASVYSTAVHGGVQNVGGGPAAGWSHRGPHVRRANASRWMIRAVQSERQAVQDEFDGLLDWVAKEFQAG